ncbi:MAG: UPF0104 family protein [Magnetospirillum sp.]|nr:UPF0104 family protein [Magnetospirillum sp.]
MLFSVAVFVGALWVLHRALGRYHFGDVLAEARRHDPRSLVSALLLALASYGALSGFDLLALRHLRRDVPKAWAALISFVSHAISHNAGFAVLSGGAVRLRMYATFGLGIAEVGGVMAFAGLSFFLGATALAAIAFIIEAERVAGLLHLPVSAIAALGAGLAAALGLYLAWTALSFRPLAIGRWRIRHPSFPLSLAQMVVAAVDLALVAAALYVLLPIDSTRISYPAFVGLYVVATMVGTLSHVPGGLGVFEGALVLLLPEARPDAVLAALLVYRVLYNLVPLMAGAAVLGVFELVQARRGREVPSWIAGLAPPLAATLAFTAGLVLLASGAAGAAAILPAWIAEPSHLLSGGVGAILLVSARGLTRQSGTAFQTAVGALALAAILALLRGPDWMTAAVAGAAASLLAASAPLFRQREALSLSPGWAVAAAVAFSATVWLSTHAGITPFWHSVFDPGDTAGRAFRGHLVAAVALAAAMLADRFPTYGQSRL